MESLELDVQQTTGQAVQEFASPQDELSSPPPSDVAEGSGGSSGGSKSKKGKGQGDASAEFVSVLNTKISELERGLAGGSVEREAAKLRRKQLREVQRFVTDKQNSTEDRIAHVQGKYAALVSDFLKMEKHYIEVQKDLELVTKERDKVQLELRKTNTLRDRLEELCRQLQRENREVLEDAKRRNDEEGKQRQSLQLKFTQAISDVTVKMEQQQEERTKQLAENDALRAKLGEVVQQFDSFSSVLQSKDLEVQLANAKLEQQQHLATQILAKADLLQQANENLNQANEVMKKELEHHLVIKEQNLILHESNRELKAQIEAYCDKFSDFQATLTKSNEMFTTLKKEIDNNNKQRGTLLREREDLRKRTERSEQSLVVLLEENQNLKLKVQRVSQALQGQGSPSDAGAGDPGEAVQKLRLQKEKLEGLCRALQSQIKAQGQQAAEGASRTSNSGDGGQGDGRETLQAAVPSAAAGNSLQGHGGAADEAAVIESGAHSAAVVGSQEPAAADCGAPGSST